MTGEIGCNSFHKLFLSLVNLLYNYRRSIVWVTLVESDLRWYTLWIIFKSIVNDVWCMNVFYWLAENYFLNGTLMSDTVWMSLNLCLTTHCTMNKSTQLKVFFSRGTLFIVARPNDHEKSSALLVYRCIQYTKQYPRWMFLMRMHWIRWWGWGSKCTTKCRTIDILKFQNCEY